jgi:hypothetical protein
LAPRKSAGLFFLVAESLLRARPMPDMSNALLSLVDEPMSGSKPSFALVEEGVGRVLSTSNPSSWVVPLLMAVPVPLVAGDPQGDEVPEVALTAGAVTLPLHGSL